MHVADTISYGKCSLVRRNVNLPLLFSVCSLITYTRDLLQFFLITSVSNGYPIAVYVGSGSEFVS